MLPTQSLPPATRTALPEAPVLGQSYRPGMWCSYGLGSCHVKQATWGWQSGGGGGGGGFPALCLPAADLHFVPQAFQRQIHERLTQLELINKQYRRLARENRTDTASKLKQMVHEGNQRWDNLQKRVTAILRRLRVTCLWVPGCLTCDMLWQAGNTAAGRLH